MPIDNLSEQGFVDIFGTQPISEPQKNPLEDFTRTEIDNSIFDVQKKEEPVQTQGTEPEEKKEEDIPYDQLPDTDLFVSDEDRKKAGRKPKYNFSDATGYFEDRIKGGKFVPLEVENDKGESIPFIPKSPEDYDQFIDFQLNHKFQEKEKEVEENWYKSKSPAWQFLAKVAEKASHPSEMLPFIQGVQQIDNLSEIDESTPEGAEKVYRTWLIKRGEPAGAIEQQIEIAKASDRLTSLAKDYKPLLIEQENTRLAELKGKQNKETQDAYKMFSENQRKAVEIIEAPIFGKQKLKDDEKAAIYDLIAEPRADVGGYGIYKAIDDLFEKKDFEKLRKIALLMEKEDSFLSYFGNKKADDTATGLLTKLKVANSPRSNSYESEPEPSRASSQRTQQPVTANYGFSRR